jgi:hypothetical protein
MVLLIAAGGIFLLISRSSGEPQVPLEKEPQVTKLTDEPVISPTPSFDGSAVWYFTSEGRLFRITGDGAAKDEYSLPPLEGLVRVSWPPAGNDFISVINTSYGQAKKFYDSNQKVYLPLSDRIENFDWMPDGKRIVYVFKSSDGKETLSIANSDGTGYRNIASLAKTGLIIRVSPNSKDALLIPSRIEGDTSQIFKADLDTGTIEPVITEGKNTAAFWLPDGYRFVFTRQVAGNSQPRVFLYNFNSRKTTDLGFNASFDRMVYDKQGKFLYAAVSSSNGGDSLIKVDVDSFALENYYDKSTDIKAKNLMLVNGTVYFVNTRDNKIYYIAK